MPLLDKIFGTKEERAKRKQRKEEIARASREAATKAYWKEYKKEKKRRAVVKARTQAQRAAKPFSEKATGFLAGFGKELETMGRFAGAQSMGFEQPKKKPKAQKKKRKKKTTKKRKKKRQQQDIWSLW